MIIQEIIISLKNPFLKKNLLLSLRSKRTWLEHGKMWIALLLQSERLFKLALTLTLPHETLKSKEKARPFYIVHLDKVKNSSWDIDFTCD